MTTMSIVNHFCDVSVVSMGVRMHKSNGVSHSLRNVVCNDFVKWDYSKSESEFDDCQEFTMEVNQSEFLKVVNGNMYLPFQLFFSQRLHFVQY